MPRHFAIALTVFLFFGPASVRAATTYHFTSAPYQTPILNHTDACAAGTCADFTTAMVQSGAFTLNTELGPNLSHVEVSGDMSAYSFSDGATSAYVHTGVQERLMYAYISTDAASNIIAADILVVRWQTANHLAGGRLDSISVGGASYANAICSAVSNPGMCTNIVGDASTSQASIGAGGPRWAPIASHVASVPVDDPFAIGLTAMALLALGLRRRRPATCGSGSAPSARWPAASKQNRRIVAFLAIAFLAATLCAGAQAASFSVDTAADLSDVTPGDGICGTGAAGTCSLRAAVMEANVLPGADTIVLPSGHYVLTQLPLAGNMLDIHSDLTITGMGASAGATVIDGNLDRLVLQISGSPVVHLHNLSIVGGSGAGSGHGGGLFIGGGTATLTQVLIQGNDAAGSTSKQGGGIYVYETATLNLIDSEVSGNAATNGGGGIAVRADATAHISRSTVRGNSLSNPGASGGGIANNGTLDIVNSTISGNTASGSGGGMSVGGGGTATIQFTTIANNASNANAGQMAAVNATVQISGSIVASPSAGLNCRFLAAAVTSGGYNLDSGTSCGFAATGDIANANALLGPLGYNGALFAQTHALLAGSAAINAGPVTGPLPLTDERGEVRVQGGRADIGAYESPFLPPQTPGGPGNVQGVPVDSPLVLALTALGVLGLARRKKAVGTK